MCSVLVVVVVVVVDPDAQDREPTRRSMEISHFHPGLENLETAQCESDSQQS